MDNYDKKEIKQLKEIWHSAQNGSEASARIEVINLLRVRPDLVPGWLLLAELLDDPQDKAQCYHKALAIDAHNKHAMLALEHLNDPSADFSVTDRPRHIPDLFADDNLPTTPQNMSAESDDGEVDLVAEEILEDETGDDSLTTADALTLYVIQELGEHGDPDDIIREVCLRGGMDWSQAEAFVKEVTLKHARTIAKKRSPLLLIIAIPTLITGVFWFLYILIAVAVAGGNTLDMIFMLLQSYGHLIGSVAMILGSSLGIYRVLKSLGKIA